MLQLEKKTLHAFNLPGGNWGPEKSRDLFKAKWINGQALVKPKWTDSKSNILSNHNNPDSSRGIKVRF